MPEKPPLQKPDPGAAAAKPKSKVNGCLMAFVITVVVTIAVVVFGGYYAVFHSSWPLNFAAKMINETGQMEVKGLQGSLATGFAADEFRIFETGLTDTYFTNISFKYNGMSDVSSEQRLIVEEFVIGRAFISLPEMNASESDDSIDAGLSEFEEIESPEELEETGSFEIKVFRIDEFVIQNPDGEEKSGSVLLSGFKADHKDLTIGELKVTGDYLEMNLEDLPATNQFRQAIRGVLKSAIHQTIRKDIDFSLEFGGEGNAKQAAFAMFDGQVQGRQNDGTMTTEYLDLTLSHYLDPSVANLPDEVTMKIVTSKDDRISEVSAGSFRIGRTKFTFDTQTIEPRDPDKNALVASAKLGGQTVMLRIPEVENSKRMKYELSSEGLELPDLVAQVLLGKDASALNDEEKEQVTEFAKNHRIDLELETEPMPVTETASTNAPATKE